MSTKQPGINSTVVKYWMENYANRGFCSLCGNCGVIDTRRTARPIKGHRVGRLNYCVCPNGQLARRHKMSLTTRKAA